MTAPTTAHFLTDIGIQEFKCFKDFKAAGFKRVNLIGGKNNVGKTAFMEAVYINVHSTNINTMVIAIGNIKFKREKINLVLKSVKNKEILSSSIKKYSAKSNLSKKYFYIEEEDAKKEYCFGINELSKRINFNDLSIVSAVIDNVAFIDNFGWTDEQLSKSYITIQKRNKEHELRDFVREFDDSIENFKVLGIQPQCEVNGEYRDITEFGDGLKHYISIICALYACENGYLFIDEIDNGIYYAHLDRLWEIILTLSKKTNCQVFATTHSKEMLESFARVAKKLDEQNISYTILVKNKQQEIKTISLDYDSIIDSVINQGHEIR